MCHHTAPSLRKWMCGRWAAPCKRLILVTNSLHSVQHVTPLVQRHVSAHLLMQPAASSSHCCMPLRTGMMDTQGFPTVVCALFCMRDICCCH
jgi:hypothetical protein